MISINLTLIFRFKVIFYARYRFQEISPGAAAAAAILVGQHGQVEEGVERGGHACYQDSDGTGAAMLQGFGTGHGLPRGNFASKIFSKPNNCTVKAETRTKYGLD